MHHRVRRNWENGRYTSTYLRLAKGTKAGNDKRHLVILEPVKLTEEDESHQQVNQVRFY